MSRPTQRRPTEGIIHCRVPDCPTTFGRIHELDRHVREVHGEKKTCPVEGCPWRGTKREHRLRDHIEKKHPNDFSVELDIPQDFSPSSSPQGTSAQVIGQPQNTDYDANANMQYTNPSPWYPQTAPGPADAPSSSPYSTGSNGNTMSTSNYGQQQPPSWPTVFNSAAPAQAGYNAAQTYMTGSNTLPDDYQFQDDVGWGVTYGYDNTSKGE